MVKSVFGLKLLASDFNSVIIESTSVSETITPGAIFGISDGEIYPSSEPMIPAEASIFGLKSGVLT